MTRTAGPDSRLCPFSIRIEKETGVALLVVEGEVDLATVPALRTQLDDCATADPVVLDLCDVVFMDSTGLQELLRAAARLDGRLHVACIPDGGVRRLMQVAGVLSALNLHASRADALTAARRSSGQPDAR